MPIKKDSLGHRTLTDSFDDFQFHFYNDKSDLIIYPGHKHQAVNDRIESLDLSMKLDIDELDTLIGTLIYLNTEMRGERRKAEEQ
ncbi:hypothetical protein [Jeotgalibaca sp. A127]|uniref:hypothetical protein n=1 Tax=Jeotgalibaca sp. A127 TaxID=3457324 RepID=UPI003FD6A156